MRKLLHYFVPVMLAALAPVHADAGVPCRNQQHGVWPGCQAASGPPVS